MSILRDYNEVISSISRKLKEKVNEQELTVDNLVQMLRDYGDGSASIKRDSVLNLLNGKKLETIRFTLKTLYALGDILEVDIDYLIGKQTISSESISMISEETGLSERAIRQLHRLTLRKDGHSANTLNLINELLCTDRGEDFVGSLVYLREVVFAIDYQIRNGYWTTDSSVEGLFQSEKDAKYSILEAQEEFQRFVYDQLDARSALKGLSRLIDSIPVDNGPPPEEEAET